MERNSNYLKRIANEEKTINAIDMHDLDYVMTFSTGSISISKTLKKFSLQSDLHTSYFQTKYIGKEKSINNKLITYLEPLLNYINYPTLVQE